VAKKVRGFDNYKRVIFVSRWGIKPGTIATEFVAAEKRDIGWERRDGSPGSGVGVDGLESS